MTFAAIMVSVDFDHGSEVRISVAAALAARFNSLLIGVAGWPLRKHRHQTSSEAGGLESPELVSKELKNLGERFRNLAGAVTDRLEWRSSMNFPREVIAAEARAADLVVIGQGLLPGDIYHTYDPGTIILVAGRPILTVPESLGRFEPSRILIAWKDTREARRAVRDALPFLRQAEDVAIAVVNPKDGERADAQIADVAQYLARHQVSVGRQIASVGDDSNADILLELAYQHDVDLIVAGAYGRTRLGEWIFGGVTRHLLLTSDVPCLFSN
jgi:nucleotide-binding universal stress UspA family protein